LPETDIRIRRSQAPETRFTVIVGRLGGRRSIDEDKTMSWSSFTARIADSVSSADPDTLMTAAEIFQEGIAQGVLAEVFNQSLLDQSRSSQRLVFGNNGSVIQHKDPRFSITIMFFKGGLKHLYYEPLHNVTILASNCPIQATRYEVQHGADDARISKQSTLLRTEDRVLRKGDMWMIDGRRELSDLHAHGDDTPLLVSLTGGKLDQLCWTFDRDTLKAWYATAVDYEVTSIVTLSELLGRLRDPASLETLERVFEESPFHYARWTAVKSIGRIDRDAGVEFLRRSLSDPHPELRQAAERTLARHGLS
jgi:hypothetical protein